MRAWLRTEDGWAVLIGLALTALGALPLLGVDSFGWVVKTNVWIDPGQGHDARLEGLRRPARGRLPRS